MCGRRRPPGADQLDERARARDGNIFEWTTNSGATYSEPCVEVRYKMSILLHNAPKKLLAAILVRTGADAFLLLTVRVLTRPTPKVN